MAQPYTGSTTPAGLGAVAAGDFVQLNYAPLAGAAVDAEGRWPHLVYSPGQNSDEAGWWTNTEAAALPVFRDDGLGLYIPAIGSIAIVGGSGPFSILLCQRRTTDGVDCVTLCTPRRLRKFQLTAQADRTAVTASVPLGAKSFNVTMPTIVSIVHGAATSLPMYVDSSAHCSLAGATAVTFESISDIYSTQLIMRGHL